MLAPQKVTMPYNEDILARARRNTFFREVVSTGPHAQVVVMSIPPTGEIGEEVHHDVDQVLVFVEGEGVAVLDGQRSSLAPGRLVHVPAGTRHNFVTRARSTSSSTPSMPRRSTRPARFTGPRPRPTPTTSTLEPSRDGYRAANRRGHELECEAESLAARFLRSRPSSS